MTPDARERFENAVLRVLWAEFSQDILDQGYLDVPLSADMALRVEVVGDPLRRLTTGTERDVVRVLVASGLALAAKEIQTAIRQKVGESSGQLRGMSTIYKTCANLKAAGLIDTARGDGYFPTPRLIAALRGQLPPAADKAG